MLSCMLCESTLSPAIRCNCVTVLLLRRRCVPPTFIHSGYYAIAIVPAQWGTSHNNDCFSPLNTIYRHTCPYVYIHHTTNTTAKRDVHSTCLL